MVFKDFSEVILLSSAKCPLNCKHCYIPEQGRSGVYNEKVKEMIKCEYGENMEQLLGNALEAIQLWGAEPVVNLPLIESQLEDWKTRLPNLSTIYFYTSLYLYRPIVSFVKECDRLGINVEMHISLNGPDFVLKNQRERASSKKIKDNFFSLVSELQELEKADLFLFWAPMLTVENIEDILAMKEGVREYLDFFQDLNAVFKKINENPNVHLKGDVSISPEEERDFTPKEGKNFSKFSRQFRNLGGSIVLDGQVKDILKKSKTPFTCGAVNNFIALGAKLSPCHQGLLGSRSLEARPNIKLENQSSKNRTNLFERKFVVGIDDELGQKRLRYVFSCYHSFYKLRIIHLKKMSRQLAFQGQIHSIYKQSPSMQNLLAWVCSIGNCPVINIDKREGIHIGGRQRMQLLGNGYLQEVVDFIL